MYGYIQNYTNTEDIYTGVINRAGNLNEWHSMGKRIIVSHWMPISVLPSPPNE